MNRVFNRPILRLLLAYLILALLLLAFFENNRRWTSQSYPFWLFGDSPMHIVKSYDLFKEIYISRFASFCNDFFHNMPWKYPPLVYLVSAVFYYFFRWSPETAIFSQAPFVILLALVIFAWGRRLWSIPVALGAVFVILSSPGYLQNSRSYLLDLPLTAMLALLLYIHYLSRGFSRRGMAVLFGLTAVLGFFTRYQMVIFLLPVMFYQLGSWLKAGWGNGAALWRIGLCASGMVLIGWGDYWMVSRMFPLEILLLLNLGAFSWLWWLSGGEQTGEIGKQIRNCLLALFIFALFSLSWMSLYWSEIRTLLQDNFQVQSLGLLQGLGRLDFWLAYQMILQDFILGPGFFLLFLGSLLYNLWNRELREKNGILLAVFLGGYILLTLAPAARPRFILPLLPSAALLLCSAVSQLKWRPGKALLILLILGLGLWQWLGWRLPGLYRQQARAAQCDYIDEAFWAREFKLNPFMINKYYRRAYSRILAVLPPWRENWREREIIGEIWSNYGIWVKQLKVGLDNRLDDLTLDYSDINSDQLSYTNYNNIAWLWGYWYIDFSPYRPGKDYVYLLSFGDDPQAYPGYKRIKMYPLPRGLKGYLFRKTGK